jgi:hypothetical protein
MNNTNLRGILFVITFALICLAVCGQEEEQLHQQTVNCRIKATSAITPVLDLLDAQGHPESPNPHSAVVAKVASELRSYPQMMAYHQKVSYADTVSDHVIYPSYAGRGYGTTLVGLKTAFMPTSMVHGYTGPILVIDTKRPELIQLMSVTFVSRKSQVLILLNPDMFVAKPRAVEELIQMFVSMSPAAEKLSASERVVLMGHIRKALAGR